MNKTSKRYKSILRSLSRILEVFLIPNFKIILEKLLLNATEEPIQTSPSVESFMEII